MERNIVLITKRKNAKLTQARLATQCGISRPFYANIERGCRVPSLNLAFRIATVLDTEIEQLFGATGNPTLMHYTDKKTDADCG